MEQSQSPFMSKLPLEIRQLIYTELLGGALIHLHSKNKKAFAKRCVSPACQHIWFLSGQETFLSFSLNILRTCWKIYIEAVKLLYSSNAFYISTVLDHQFTLIELPNLFKPHRLFQIRSLDIHWNLTRFDHFKMSRRGGELPLSTGWFVAWELLRRMTGLRRLHVQLIMFDLETHLDVFEKWVEVEDEMFRPVKKMTAPKDFVIVLPSRLCSTMIDPGESNCKFELPEAAQELEPA